jgi:hypothetical protein
MILQELVADTLTGAIRSPMDWRDWLEAIYWVAGIVIAISVVAVFRQVQMAKLALEAAQGESELRSEREAIILAAQRCERYAEKVIPLSEQVGDELRGAGLKVQQWEMTDDDFGPGSIIDSAGGQQWIQAYDKVKADHLMTLLNEMEAFAIYFAKGAADEQVAFSAIGTVYCFDVRNYAPVLIECRRRFSEGSGSGPFENLISLYKIWSSRIRHDSLRAKAQLAADEAARVVVPEMPAVGTRASRKSRRSQ